MRSRARTGFLALVMMASAGLLSAQTRTGTINGTVTDESGAVLPGVTVTLTSEALIWHGDEPGDNARLVLRQAIEAALTADRRLRCAVQILTGGDMNRASTTLVAIATLTGALTASPPSPAVPAQKAGRLLTIGTLVDTKHPSAPLRISRRRGDAPLAGFRATGGRGKLVAFKLFPNW
jgi:hypothetical protein